MKAEDFGERRDELHGWPVNVTTYRLGSEYHCKVDNVSPGAALARSSGATREAAEQSALADAARRLARTRRQAV